MSIFRQATIGLAIVSLLLIGGFDGSVFGQSATPAITSISGQWTHGSSVTIQGSEFGAKPTAAPWVWDDCSGTNVLTLWNGALPNAGPTTSAHTQYRTPIRGVALPHSRITKYLAGAHADSSGSNAGWTVLFWKNRTFTNGSYSYASWYQRSDPNWVFSGCDGPGACDDNFKTTVWATGTDAPYGEPFWYANYNPQFKSANGTAGWSTSTLPGGQYNWGETASNYFQQWSKIEYLARWSTGSDGFVRIYDNGRLVFQATGPTDYGVGTARTEVIGGYARQYGYSSNWRYFADIYLDTSLAHVILGNAPTLNASTRREVQIPTAWSSSGGSISLRVNLGAFSAGQVAYLYVYNTSGIANSTGFPITVGGTATPPPTSPSNLRIIR